MLSLARHSDKMLCILNDAEIKLMLKSEIKMYSKLENAIVHF